MVDHAVTANTGAMERFGIGRLFWVTHEAVVGADLESEAILLWNPSAEALFGYSAAEAIGMPLETIVAPHLRAAHHAGLARFRATHVPQLIGGPPVAVEAVARDGRCLHVALTLADVSTDPPGRHVVAVIRDVTAQHEAEEGLRRAHEAMRDFVATASHDLRTPLTAVLGFARTLRDRGAAVTEAQRTQFLDAIVRGGEQASRLVDDLLTLSKIDSGLIHAQIESLSLRSVVDEAVDTSGTSPELDLPDALAIAADRDHVVRILVNLLSNAQKYGSPPVRLSAAAQPTRVAVRVSDAGGGVPEDFRARLFDRFTRHAGHHAVEGTGLGLAIVRGLALANGGDASYEDLPGGGACFRIDLPRAGP